MPSAEEPQQQAPMEMTATDGVVAQQPTSEPPIVYGTMRGGEEAGCEFCCGLCACDEACC
ncbi:uncharacterized protein F4822DRAFT_426023 [Hypoxylon trugodes]|uniref:uncharacterized protein n=1 Tax=Hypoxylon trugodes TaxID=326681 RepID=UPI0021999A02|nr:uncharacterized protein F4822DRAFT_426023 [Hypoxylon trugodes]KAI1392818.1 hypothetical protein F4822DRAFT_426023 [Hypoxylon trugodes]